MLDIFIDADGCPVKPEVYRVAQRYGLRVTLVSNTWMRTPPEDWIELVVVDGQPDAADDWIVEHVRPHDIVISGDIPLASRCLEKGALVLGPTGRVFTQDSIGEALASRDLMSQLRDLGTVTGGPAPFEKRDRSRFLQRLDETIQAARRRKEVPNER
ncbi:MAG: YaiI/YqxD family protein [Candidatus Latescibacteria bacterium]|nr:YaiI/YqxD family protein [Candidatus Latescibacterota bacterium]